MLDPISPTAFALRHGEARFEISKPFLCGRKMIEKFDYVVQRLFVEIPGKQLTQCGMHCNLGA